MKGRRGILGGVAEASTGGSPGTEILPDREISTDCRILLSRGISTNRGILPTEMVLPNPRALTVASMRP